MTRYALMVVAVVAVLGAYGSVDPSVFGFVLNLYEAWVFIQMAPERQPSGGPSRL
jgi:hypothetical protein